MDKTLKTVRKNKRKEEEEGGTWFLYAPFLAYAMPFFLLRILLAPSCLLKSLILKR